MISVIVPTYNEVRNIGRLIPLIYKALLDHRIEIIVVDDNSPDGTADVAKELSKTYPVRVFVRKNERGLASAVVYGFRRARGDILAVIDADLQHPPELLGKMVELVLRGFDIVVASRYVEGGGVESCSWHRQIISKFAIMLSRPLTDIRDPMSGYFAMKREVIEGVNLNPVGYKILLEILVKGKYERVIEIPYTFRTRRAGSSKMGVGEILNYLRHLYHLYSFKILHERSRNGR